MEIKKFYIKKNGKIYQKDNKIYWFDTLEEADMFRKILKLKDEEKGEVNRYELILKIERS